MGKSEHSYAILPVSRRRQAALNASCAWSGFITATDRKLVDAFLRRSKRSRFCSPIWRHIQWWPKLLHHLGKIQ